MATHYFDVMYQGSGCIVDSIKKQNKKTIGKLRLRIFCTTPSRGVVNVIDNNHTQNTIRR